ncbi:hypothetical protein [Loktanella sp. SALINAS62]|nr:hypothetical protein [Loktanella sp. SALINAS62]MBS1301249.1 hypothetical protein [Loktanella sp. SALINAS62]
MKRTTLIAVAAALGLTACAQPMPVSSRADNDMLRFSTRNYIAVVEGVQ